MRDVIAKNVQTFVLLLGMQPSSSKILRPVKA